MSTNSKNFPFTAITGQDEMKLALILNVIDPKIGGVMIMGDRGTGKSTTIRSLVDLLPEIKRIKNDPFNTNPEKFSDLNLTIETIKTPMVELPLGATEDRVCGTINIKQIFSSGDHFYEPGILARANRGLLYVDEINLLDDHLVDILLDSAASGWNTVEREGVSIKHPAQFILIGSANPEEGELRPQLLDRFGLFVEIKTISEPKLRMKIVEERIDFEKNTEKWYQSYSSEQVSMKEKIVNAQNILTQVMIDPTYQLKISEICSQLKVEGMRGDIVSTRAAKALAAFDNRKEVTVDDIKKVITFSLKHRLKKDPTDSLSSASLNKKILELVENVFSAS